MYLLDIHPQKYNFFVFVFNSTEIETTSFKMFCVTIPSFVYTCRDFGLFRVVRHYEHPLTGDSMLIMHLRTALVYVKLTQFPASK